MIKHMKRLCSALCGLVLVFGCMAGLLMTVSAADDGALTLWCVKGDDKVAGMQWHIYRVGHRSDSDYVFDGDFADYRLTLGDETKSMLEWDADTVADAGETLKAYTVADEIPAIADGTTDSAGRVIFSGLQPGLYLVWGEILQTGNTIYIPSAVFFEMRGEDDAVLNAYPKIILRSLDNSSVDYSVRKVWLNDESQPQNRAASVTVARYRDNQFYDEITLSEENAWTCEWEDTVDHVWFVREKVIPAGYTVACRQRQTQYLIINTYTGTDVQTETTTTATTLSTAETQDTAASSSESSTVTTTAAVTTTTAVTDKIPQTGQLWWPVPCLAGSGMLLLGLGFILRRKEEEE